MSISQVGHAGTLDPMATGLLIVCIGKATKVVDRFVVPLSNVFAYVSIYMIIYRKYIKCPLYLQIPRYDQRL